MACAGSSSHRTNRSSLRRDTAHNHDCTGCKFLERLAFAQEANIRNPVLGHHTLASEYGVACITAVCKRADPMSLTKTSGDAVKEVTTVFRSHAQQCLRGLRHVVSFFMFLAVRPGKCADSLLALTGCSPTA
eukprot:5029559-Amphidinium_carterae.3